MRTFRACLSSYIVFTVICGIPLIIGIFAAAKSHSALPLVAIAISAFLFSCFWLSRFRLEFNSERIGYASLFRPYRSIQRDTVVHADFASDTSAYESPFTFVVRSALGDELRINAKVFSREAFQHLLELGAKRSNQSLQPTAGRSDE